MQDVDGRRAYFVRLRAEHRRLDELVRDVQAALFGVAAVEGSTETVETRLRALRLELARHFTEEEEGGCIEEAVSRQPSLATEARRMEDEHPDLLGQLDSLIQRAPSLAHNSVSAQFSEFAARLRDHEGREVHLIEQGFNLSAEHDSGA